MLLYKLIPENEPPPRRGLCLIPPVLATLCNKNSNLQASEYPFSRGCFILDQNFDCSPSEDAVSDNPAHFEDRTEDVTKC